MNTQFPAQNDEKIAWRIVDNQAVVLSLEDKQIRGLNPVGTRIWELIDGNTPLDHIAQIISREFDISPAQAKQDAQEFVRELKEKGLISWDTEQ